MFPVETLKGIQETAQKAQAAQWIAVNDPRVVHYQINGDVKQFAVPPAVRDHRTLSLDDLVEYATASSESSENGIVWHADNAVTLVVNNADRRDRVVFNLALSREVLALIELEKTGRAGLTQTAFIRLLRITLGQPADQVARFRKLAWTASEGNTANVRQAKESLDRSMMAEVSGTDGLPDQIDVVVPVYRQMGERARASITCAIEIDAPNQTLELMPLPGVIDRVIQDAQASIHERLGRGLAATAIPVYYGSP